MKEEHKTSDYFVKNINIREPKSKSWSVQTVLYEIIRNIVVIILW